MLGIRCHFLLGLWILHRISDRLTSASTATNPRARWAPETGSRGRRTFPTRACVVASWRRSRFQPFWRRLRYCARIQNSSGVGPGQAIEEERAAFEEGAEAGERAGVEVGGRL